MATTYWVRRWVDNWRNDGRKRTRDESTSPVQTHIVYDRTGVTTCNLQAIRYDNLEHLDATAHPCLKQHVRRSTKSVTPTASMGVNTVRQAGCTTDGCDIPVNKNLPPLRGGENTCKYFAKSAGNFLAIHVICSTHIQGAQDDALANYSFPQPIKQNICMAYNCRVNRQQL